MPSVHSQIGKGVELTLKKSAYLRTLDNITVVVVAFDGLAKLFEQTSIIENDPMEQFKYKKNNPQFRSTDNMRKTNKSLREEGEKLGKYSFDMREDNLVGKSRALSKKTRSHHEANSAGRMEPSERISEANSSFKNRMSEDGRKNKSSTLNEMQLYPIRKMDHGLKDARGDNVTKTPVLTKNSKMEGLTSMNNFSYNDQVNRSVK